MRRLFLIIAGVVVILGVVAFVYFAFLTPDGATLTTDNGNPFADTGAGDVAGGAAGTSDTGPVVVSGAGKQLGPSLVRVTTAPAAEGFVAFYLPPPSATTTNSTTTALANATADTEVRFIDRASGNVYSYLVHAHKLVRISNRTIPGIERASWLPDGSLAFVQYLSQNGSGSDHVETFALPANGEGGYVLERDLEQAIVGDQSTVLTLASNGAGSTAVYAKPDGTGARTAFSTLLSSVSAALSGKNLVVYTKPSSRIDGYGFSTDGGTLTRLIGPLPGLSLLPSPDGKSILYSYLSSDSIRLAVYTIATHASTVMPLSTLTEKCVWAPDGTSFYCAVPTSLSGSLPDDWYQGSVGFSDRIWKLDLATRLATLVVDPSQVGAENTDAIALTIDPKSDALVFTDKRSHALYVYDL